jgi:hypothetical protein
MVSHAGYLAAMRRAGLRECLSPQTAGLVRAVRRRQYAGFRSRVNEDPGRDEKSRYRD